MEFKILENKKILILGLGLTGYETARAISKYKNNLVIIANNQNSKYAQELKEKNFVLYTEEEFVAQKINIDIILKSPGIPIDHCILQKNKQAIQINDIELSYLYIKEQQLATKIIAVTGTNGKTTSTMFINELLINAGFNSKVSGNIGISPLTILNQNNNLDYLVMELSSFQLYNIKNFTPHASFITNITPDHIEYHHSFKEYAQTKLKIFQNQSSETFVYLNSNLDQYLKPNKKGVKFIFDDLDEENNLILQKFTQISLNFNNLKLIYKFSQNENIDKNIFIKTCQKFCSLPHRQEFVYQKNGIKYYNDSKATNMAAMIDAINKFDNIILLVGGRSKGEDFTDFEKYLKNVKKVIAYGENRKEFIADKIIGYKKNLKEALLLAEKESQPGDTILLSPASASFDEFQNFEKRGEYFKSLVKGEKK